MIPSQCENITVFSRNIV